MDPSAGAVHGNLTAPDHPVKGIGEPFEAAHGQIHAAALANDEPAGALLMGRDFSTAQDTTGAELP